MSLHYLIRTGLILQLASWAISQQMFEQGGDVDYESWDYLYPSDFVNFREPSYPKAIMLQSGVTVVSVQKNESPVKWSLDELSLQNYYEFGGPSLPSPEYGAGWEWHRPPSGSPGPPSNSVLPKKVKSIEPKHNKSKPSKSKPQIPSILPGSGGNGGWSNPEETKIEENKAIEEIKAIEETKAIEEAREKGIVKGIKGLLREKWNKFVDKFKLKPLLQQPNSPGGGWGPLPNQGSSFPWESEGWGPVSSNEGPYFSGSGGPWDSPPPMSPHFEIWLGRPIDKK